MGLFTEKAQRIYGGEKEQKASWVTVRKGNTAIRQVRNTMPTSNKLSQVRAEEIFAEQSWSAQAITLINDMVAEALKGMGFDQRSISSKIEHFQSSWEKMYDEFYAEYGNLFFEACLEMAGEYELVGYDGYIDKQELKKKIKEIRKRNR